MTDPERERHEALKRYAIDVDREIDRLRKRCDVRQARTAVVEARQKVLKDYREDEAEAPEELLLLPSQYLKKDSLPERRLLEHLDGLRQELAIRLRNLAMFHKEDPDANKTTDYSEPILPNDLLDKLALLAVEKWSPGQDIEELTEQVRTAYLEARKHLESLNPPSESKGIQVISA